MVIPGHPRIEAIIGVCGGRPVIKGTRMRVVDILEMMGGGMTETEIAADFPYVEVEDVRAALTYAADGARHPVLLAAE